MFMLAYLGTTWLTLNGLEAVPADVIHAVRMGAGRWSSQIQKICKLDGVSFPTLEVWEWDLKSILNVFTVVMLRCLLDSWGSGWDWYQASALAYIKQAHMTIHNSSLSSDEQQLL